jgi:hypothetical protein
MGRAHRGLAGYSRKIVGDVRGMKRFVAGVGGKHWRDWARARGLPRVLSPLSRRLALHREDGQAVVEFALVLIPLLLILFGTLELGRAWNNKNDAVHIANEAVRMAAVNQFDCPTLTDEANTDGLNKGTQITTTTAAVGAAVKASVTAPFSSSLLTLLPFIPSSLSASATMRAEQATTAQTCTT